MHTAEQRCGDGRRDRNRLSRTAGAKPGRHGHGDGHEHDEHQASHPRLSAPPRDSNTSTAPYQAPPDQTARASGSQNEPSSPRDPKIRRISAGPGRRAAADIREAYQCVASPHNCAIVTTGPIGTPRAVHHSWTRSSDRKKSMLFQVNTRSCHHCAAGTREWKIQELGPGPSRPTSSCSGSWVWAQWEWTIAGECSAAGIPRASQAQLA